MDEQLHLIQGGSPGGTRTGRWQLDEPTREAGRRGVEAARRALREARRHHLVDDAHHAPEAA